MMIVWFIWGGLTAYNLLEETGNLIFYSFSRRVDINIIINNKLRMHQKEVIKL